MMLLAVPHDDKGSELHHNLTLAHATHERQYIVNQVCVKQSYMGTLLFFLMIFCLVNAVIQIVFTQALMGQLIFCVRLLGEG